jgi:hypothetical protein
VAMFHRGDWGMGEEKAEERERLERAEERREWVVGEGKEAGRMEQGDGGTFGVPWRQRGRGGRRGVAQRRRGATAAAEARRGRAPRACPRGGGGSRRRMQGMWSAAC